MTTMIIIIIIIIIITIIIMIMYNNIHVKIVIITGIYKTILLKEF